MKQKLSLKAKVAGLVLALGMLVAPVALMPATVSASNNCTNPKDCITKGSDNAKTGATDIDEVIKSVTNLLLFLVGAVSVIMLVLGGFKYVTSNGNADQIKSAKNTIMYAVIGLAVAIIAYAAVDFVVDALIADPPADGGGSGGGGVRAD